MLNEELLMIIEHFVHIYSTILVNQHFSLLDETIRFQRKWFL